MVTVTLNPAIDHAVTIPGFRANTVNRVTHESRTAGGKGINVASFLADLGIPTVATGFLGRANEGLFVAHFKSKGIEDRFVRLDGESRVNLKVLNPTDNELTDINHPGLTPTAADLIQLESILDALASDHDWFVLSGSLPPGVSPATYRSLVVRLCARQCKVLLDTSGDGLAQALSANPTVIKPNLREFEEVLGRRFTTEADLLAAARGLVRDGIECVIVSRGADGALFVESRHALAARYPWPVNIRTTVGAGDALVAGHLAARWARLDAEAAARLAIASSIAALERVGTDPLPARPKLAELTMNVEVMPRG
jgi:1-phosphofructokinase